MFITAALVAATQLLKVQCAKRSGAPLHGVGSCSALPTLEGQGFRVTPVEIEFWHDRPFRLHDRIEFRRDAPNQPWSKVRLYP